MSLGCRNERRGMDRGACFCVAHIASQPEQRSGIGIFFLELDWSFSLWLPDFLPFFLADFMAIILALRKLSISISFTASSEYKHLSFPWCSDLSNSRMMEVAIRKFCCRVGSFNFYLHRSGLVSSPLCLSCNQEETIGHFFLSCRQFTTLRKRIL